MSEFRLHALFFVVAALGLAAGLLVPLAGADWLANPLFSAAALPVILLLAWSMLRDFLAACSQARARPRPGRGPLQIRDRAERLLRRALLRRH